MRLALRMHCSRSLRRHAAVAGAACLLLAATAACGPAEGTAAPSVTVESAVDLMTAEESASVIADLDAPVSEVRELLRELGQDSGTRRAQQLVEAEVAIALEADGPLNERESYGPGTRLALALCLGDRDAVAYKSVGRHVYVRLQLGELARRGRLTARQQERLDEIVGLAGRLPESLKAVGQLLRGGWVRVDPKAFADYGWAVEEFTGLPLAGTGHPGFRGATALLDGGELRAALSGLEDVLVKHGRYEDEATGKGTDDVRRLRAELPARRTAKALAPLLGPLGTAVNPREVPKRPIPAELTIRRGSLAELRIDLGELTEGGSAEVPLRLRFSPGDVFSPNPPDNALQLEPQDLLTAALYAVTQPSS